MRLSAIALLLTGLLAFAVPAAGQIYLELGAPPVRDTIPPDGSDWHELYPTFCIVHQQVGYEDNGDGVVSPCDNIVLDGGLRYHVDWVGPTYFLAAQSGEPKFCEPTTPETGGDPTGHFWHEVAPNFCTEWRIDEWLDNGDGVVSECDHVLIGGQLWHIEEIRLDITVTEEPNPVDESTWSRIKEIFGKVRNLF